MSVTSLFRLPRRTPKPGRHTIAAVRSQQPQAEAPGVAEAPEPLPLEPLPAPPPAAFAEPDTTLLARVRDRLHAIPDAPVAYLRNITPGPGRDPHEPLGGLPCFAGTTRMLDGSPVAGLFLSDQDADGRLVLDALSVAWLGGLIDAAEEAREELHALMSDRRDEAGAA